MKFRIKQIPQLGDNIEFYVPVNTPEEGWKIRTILSDYDMFLYENNLKSNYNFMCYLEYWDEIKRQWLEWHDENGLNFRKHFEIDDYN